MLRGLRLHSELHLLSWYLKLGFVALTLVADCARRLSSSLTDIRHNP